MSNRAFRPHTARQQVAVYSSLLIAGGFLFVFAGIVFGLVDMYDGYGFRTVNAKMIVAGFAMAAGGILVPKIGRVLGE